MQTAARDLPEFDESLMQEQGHKVPSHVVALPCQKYYSVPRLWTELQLQLHVLICGAKSGEREPTLACEPR